MLRDVKENLNIMRWKIKDKKDMDETSIYEKQNILFKSETG